MNRAAFALTIAIGAAGAALAGCGSGSHAGSGARLTGSKLAFAECMRAHAVSGFPDPTPPGDLPAGPFNSVFGFVLPATIDTEAPAFKAAMQSCAKLIIGNRPRPPRSDNHSPELKFAECMRANGVPDYPDPPAATSGPIQSIGPNVNLDTPAAKHASRVCGASP
jgi:hypothetical protein